MKKALDNKNLFKDAVAYPTTLEQAYQYLQNFQPEGGNTGDRVASPLVDHGTAFFEKGNLAFHGCGDKSHILKYCPMMTGSEKSQIYRAVKAKQDKETGQGIIMRIKFLSPFIASLGMLCTISLMMNQVQNPITENIVLTNNIHADILLLFAIYYESCVVLPLLPTVITSHSILSLWHHT